MTAFAFIAAPPWFARAAMRQASQPWRWLCAQVVNRSGKYCKISRMMPTRSMATIYQFGPFRLDLDAGILFRGAEPTLLGQRAVALLRVLLGAAGNAGFQGGADRGRLAGACGRGQQPDGPDCRVAPGLCGKRRRRATGSRPCRAAAIAMSGRRSRPAIRTPKAAATSIAGAASAGQAVASPCCRFRI